MLTFNIPLHIRYNNANATNATEEIPQRLLANEFLSSATPLSEAAANYASNYEMYRSLALLTLYKRQFGTFISDQSISLRGIKVALIVAGLGKRVA